MNPQLRPDALRDVIDNAGGNPTDALTQHVATHSPLTTADATSLVATALAATPAGDSTAKANATSQAVASALPGVNVELSEAVMLNGTV